MSVFQVLFGEPLGALVIPLVSAGVTAGWKILVRPGRPTPSDWDVGLELVVAGIVVNLIFLGSGEPAYVTLRLAYLLLAAAALLIIAVLLKVIGHEKIDYGGQQVYELKPRAAIGSSITGVVLLIVLYVGNINAELIYSFLA